MPKYYATMEQISSFLTASGGEHKWKKSVIAVLEELGQEMWPLA